MFNRLSAKLLPVGLAIAFVVTAAPVAAATAPSTSDADAASPTIQYQEYLSHAGRSYAFTAGGPASVAYMPRAGDQSIVDGAAPVALPGARNAVPILIPGPATSGSANPAGTIVPLRREVFGFLPYWELGSTLDYDTLSTVAYFGVTINGDGSLYQAGNGWSGWNSSKLTTVINDAHAHGTRVELTAQSFAWSTSEAATQTALLSSPTASLNTAELIAAAVAARGVDGVNLDFEPIASGQHSNFVAFVRMLRMELDKLHPGYELTFCATGAPNTYLLPDLLADGAADAVFIMGYDLRGSSPTTAGSVDPLAGGLTRYTLTSVTQTFLGQVPASKIILGLPWYGAAFSTATSHGLNPPIASASTYGKPVEAYYDTLSAIAAMTDSTHLGKFYDTNEETAWTAYYGTFGGQPTWREGYFDDARALGAKCDAIDGWNLRGVGIWALGYDNNNGDGDLTAEIAAKFETGVAATTYTPMLPIRLIDTRTGTGPTGKLSANVPHPFQVAGLVGVDATATAVTGNLTVVNETSSGALYLGPYDRTKPTTSTINFKAGDVVGNGVTVALSATGGLSATYMAGSGNKLDIVFDVTGYFAPNDKGSTYHPIPPARSVDSRVKFGAKSKLHANVPLDFQVTTLNNIPIGAVAVTADLTVVNSTHSGAVYLGPTDVSKPLASTINFKRAQVIGNDLTVQLSDTGMLSAMYLAPNGNTTDFVLDITGFYTADTSGYRFVPVTPARMLDTRSGTGSGGKISANSPRPFQVDGRICVPLTATAITGNLAVVNETSSGAVYVGPVQVPKPTTSSINFRRGDVRANGITVMVGGTPVGLAATFMAARGNKTDLVLDVTGYFVP
jgi:spore germination protein YaaH